MTANVMSPATAEDLQHVLGDVDALVIERILATEATADEVAAALAELVEEQQLGARRIPASPRVAAVLDILEELADDYDDEDYAG